jgi:hypothetical protein
LQVDEISRSIQIVQIGDTALQILNPNARTLLKGVIKPDVLDEVIAVSIDNEFLADALGKILPNGWNVMLSMFSLLSFVPQLDTINIKSVSVDNKVSLFII